MSRKKTAVSGVFGRLAGRWKKTLASLAAALGGGDAVRQWVEARAAASATWELVTAATKNGLVLPQVAALHGLLALVQRPGTPVKPGESVLARAANDPDWYRVQVTNVALLETIEERLPTAQAEAEAMLLALSAGPGDAKPLDAVNDPRCKAVVLILGGGPSLGPAIARDKRCPCSYSTLRDVVLPAMREFGMIEQTRTRGPYRLVSTKPKK